MTPGLRDVDAAWAGNLESLESPLGSQFDAEKGRLAEASLQRKLF